MLLYNIESIAKKMTIDYLEVTNHIEHMGLRGSSRENILRKYIRQLLPQKFSVGSGIITDVNGIQSRQQDFFVYDAFNSPIFLNMESSSVIPVESVYATVEVKSRLTKETLRQSIENIVSVKELECTVYKNNFFIPNIYNFILGTVFAYTSDSTIETIVQNVYEICKNIPKEKQPSMICVLDKGMIVNVLKNGMNKIEVIPSEETTWAYIKNSKENNLYLYYLIFQQHLNSTINFPPDLLKYAEATKALDNIQISIPKDNIPNDLRIKVGDSFFSGEEMRFLGDNSRLMFELLTNQITEEELNKRGKSIEEIELIKKKFVELISQSFGDNAVKSEEKEM